eukprot:725289-Hanusia_phi.AAC.2
MNGCNGHDRTTRSRTDPRPSLRIPGQVLPWTQALNVTSCCVSLCPGLGVMGLESLTPVQKAKSVRRDCTVWL